MKEKGAAVIYGTPVEFLVNRADQPPKHGRIVLVGCVPGGMSQVSEVAIEADDGWIYPWHEVRRLRVIGQRQRG